MVKSAIKLWTIILCAKQGCFITHNYFHFYTIFWCYFLSLNLCFFNIESALGPNTRQICLQIINLMWWTCLNDTRKRLITLNDFPCTLSAIKFRSIKFTKQPFSCFLLLITVVLNFEFMAPNHIGLFPAPISLSCISFIQIKTQDQIRIKE